MWQSVNERLALLELLVRGTLKLRRAQAQSWTVLSELPWTRRTGRRDEIGLVASRREELVALLDRVWPAWGAALAELTAQGLSPTPDGWAALEDAQRALGLSVLPERLNRRTAASLVAPHSKATLTARRRAALGAIEPSHDGSLRIRPPKGLRARLDGAELDLSMIASALGEVSLPERALRTGLTLEGPVRAILLVENLGAFCDLPVIDGWLFAHVAGWDTSTLVHLFQRFPEVPTIHFGDLDPNGLRIYQHIRTIRPELHWFVPSFWEEQVASRGLSALWPDHLDLSEAPELVKTLARQGVWLEQEPIVLDPRTPVALESQLSAWSSA